MNKEALREWEFKMEQTHTNLKSYPENEEITCCEKCNGVLRYNSISYHEGFHIDGCD